MNSCRITEGLNQHQYSAVTSKPKNMLVLAGAGSGKTRVLVNRIAWLIQEEHCSPASILAVTFTNKAATEMRGRIEHLLQFNSTALWVGTFHSIAHRLLRLHWKEAGLSQHFQILDSEDQYRLIRRTVKALELDESQWPPKQIQSYINQQKDLGLRPNQVAKPRDPFHLTLLRLYFAYEEACVRSSLVDFAEILLRSYELLIKNQHLLQHYQQRFQHILIDEFQDTNAIQYQWIRLFAGATNFVMCVGDDDQSIYGWRGADVENIQRFLNDFPGTEVIRLEQNYRSTPIILHASNIFIAHNQNRMGKNLWTEQQSGEPITLYAAFNDIDEARFIVNRIQAWKRNSNSYRDIAILYRSNAQSRVIEESLIAAGIPYRIYGGLRFFERAEIKDALAYLRLLANRDDDAAFERVINTPVRGIGDKTVECLREQAKKLQLSLWEAAHHSTVHEKLTARSNNALQNFLNLIKKLDQDIAYDDLPAKIEKIINDSGLAASYSDQKNENALMRLENLHELISAAQEYAAHHSSDEPALTSFLSEVALDSGEMQQAPAQDYVQLMTLHNAKGLEFPLVFISGLEEGLFPHAMSLEEHGRLSEERRLCYVGMTRAMEKLYLTYAEIRRLHGKEVYHRPSRFIHELPESALEHVRVQTRQTRNMTTPLTTSLAARQYVNASTEMAGFKLGQSVIHPTLGEGTILNFEGSGPQARVEIKFRNAGTKWLVLAFAHLKALILS